MSNSHDEHGSDEIKDQSIKTSCQADGSVVMSMFSRGASSFTIIFRIHRNNFKAALGPKLKWRPVHVPAMAADVSCHQWRFTNERIWTITFNG
jgi:hypothetical protein